METSSPDRTDSGDVDSLNMITFPQLNTFLHLAEDGKDKFDESLAQGLPLFHENHPMGGFQIPVVPSST